MIENTRSQPPNAKELFRAFISVFLLIYHLGAALKKLMAKPVSESLIGNITHTTQNNFTGNDIPILVARLGIEWIRLFFESVIHDPFSLALIALLLLEWHWHRRR